MKICMLLSGNDFPGDLRVENEAEALTTAGHNIIIVCASRHDRPLHDSWRNCLLERIPRPGNLLYRKFNTLFYMTTFVDLYWLFRIKSIIRKNRVEALHVHDLPMLRTAVILGRLFHIPVIADFHENYPAAVPFYHQSGLNKQFLVFYKLLYSVRRWQKFEAKCAAKSSGIIVVVDEARERIAQYGIPKDKFEVIDNTPDSEGFLRLDVDYELVNKYKDRFVILYLGGFGGSHRGMDTAIIAMSEIVEKIPEAELLLIGKGPFKKEMVKIVSELSLERNVTITDQQPFKLMPTFIEMSSVCIVPHNSNPHTEATSPHKLFQYMLMGKPVVVSSCRPLKRIIEETGAGVVFEAGDSHSFAEAVIRLYNDPELREQMGQAGKKAVLEKYNWNITAKRLVRFYSRFTPESS